MKKGAIFDMDGLMFDSEKLSYNCWKETAVHFGQAFEDSFYRSILGTTRKHILKVISETYPEVDPDTYLAYAAASFEEKLSVHVPVKRGLFEILAFFKELGIKTAVASSSRKELILSNLKIAGVTEYFDVVVSGEQVKNSKPAPDVFLYAAEELGLAPEDCYVFEDSFNGIRAGVAAGCTTVMIPDMVEATEEIRALYHAEYESLLHAMEAIKTNEI